MLYFEVSLPYCRAFSSSLSIPIPEFTNLEKFFGFLEIFIRGQETERKLTE